MSKTALAKSENGVIHLPQQDDFSRDVWEFIASGGDLAQLDDAGKATYYRMRCEAAGLDPATFPFQLITLQGKLTLYATKTATDQLCHKRNVSTQILGRETLDGVHIVTCRAVMGNGRFTDATGAVTVERLKGDALCNALMKAETKAKRRAVLALCGLGALDESEIETIPGAKVQPLPAFTPATDSAASSTPKTGVEIADAALLQRCENARQRAIQCGYKTDAGTLPKPVAEGATRREAEAKAQKWELFAARVADEVADEAGETGWENEGESRENEEQQGVQNGLIYEIPAGVPMKPCAHCRANIVFLTSKNGKPMPVNADGEQRGLSHFATCPDGEKFRRFKSAHDANNPKPARKSEPKTAPEMPKHLKQLWAVASAAGLPTKPEARDARLYESNRVLLDHRFDVVESWNDLTPDQCACLRSAIDAGILTWGESLEAGEAA